VSPLQWSEEDGSVLKPTSGFASYYGYMIERGQMFYTNPNQLGCIDSLFSPTVYAR
jgi:hypothetical protein